MHEPSKMNDVFSGPDTAFVFPDLETAIVGHFEDGHLVCGHHAKIVACSVHNGIACPIFEVIQDSKGTFRVRSGKYYVKRAVFKPHKLNIGRMHSSCCTRSTRNKHR
jgi:hypothetical protein